MVILTIQFLQCEPIHDQQEITNLFNEYFAEIGEKLSGEIPSTNVKHADYIKQNECTFKLREPLSILTKYKTIDTSKIESILKKLFRRFD